MDSAHIFISHTTADDGFVKRLREALTARGLTVWDDARYLRGGDELWPEIARAIEAAQYFIVVFSQQSLSSNWVRKEFQHARQIEAQRRAEGKAYRVIPVLLDDAELGALRLVFAEERAVIRVNSKPGDLTEKMKEILAALGRELPADAAPPPAVEENPFAELLLELRRLTIETAGDKRRAKAEATLVYQPPGAVASDVAAREVKSDPFFFTSPLGPIEADDLGWYLEKFYQWPVGQFKARGDRIAKQLPEWGKLLYQAALEDEAAREPLRAWLDIAGKAERRFSIEVSDKLPKGSPPEAVAAAKEAATLLLSLPWELLHDGRGYLFHGKHAVRVRRRLPNRIKLDAVTRQLPIRVLLVSPRPEDDKAAYIDHRVSAKPLVEAIEALGDLVNLTILPQPTFPALQQALPREQFDVVHFDGHGVFDPRVGLGQLCFEAPDQDDQLERRRSELIDAARLAEVMRDHRIPLILLEACQSAKSDEDPTASVAAKLLEQGVVSVVAMTHTVLVETARRFVGVFYRELAEGARVGAAMLAGQQALHADTRRGAIAGAGEFHLQDWFVPVLYQERQDPPLVLQRLSEHGREETAIQRKFSLGELPKAPEHSFVGRSRELLALERLLLRASYAVIRGAGGEGKTTLAVELARWLVQTHRFRRAAFVSLEQYSDAKGAADTIGRQLVGASYTASLYKDWRAALLPINRELQDKPTIIVVDNVESVLMQSPTSCQLVEDSRQGPTAEDPDKLAACRTLDDIFALCQVLLDAHPATRIVFTSREHLPKPFANRDRVIALDRLSREDAVLLVSRVLRRREYDEQGNTPEDIAELVEAVNRHARALTLLAREVKASGVRATTDNLRPLMARLEQAHPGDRENSLYASVELSLRRLPAELREQVKVLAVFHGGAHFGVLAAMFNPIGQDFEAAERLGAALIEVGLAEAMPYGYLRIDPSLPNYLLAHIDAAELSSFTERWAVAMKALTGFLYEQHFQNTQLAAQLTLLELPNLLVMIGWVAARETPELVVDLAQVLEKLLQYMGRPKVLAQATRVREAAARKLDTGLSDADWSHAHFQSESANIDRLLERGQLPQAKAAAQTLLNRCRQAGEIAFAGAAYNLAEAHYTLGKVFEKSGEHEAALLELAEAEQRFAALGVAGDAGAERMAMAAIGQRGHCLWLLGRLDEATVLYEEIGQRAEKFGDQRSLAVSNLQLANIRIYQRRYAEALVGLAAGREIFERLGEPGQVAIAWHQTGMAHRQAGQFEQAELAYRQSLRLKVQQQNAIGEAHTLCELGNLASEQGKLPEAATWYQQARDIYIRLGDRMNEGIAHGSLADKLVRLERYDEARAELRRALECFEPFGHSAEPWKAWAILHNLEQATGQTDAAAVARARAVATFLSYRRAGGENHDNGAQLCVLVRQALQQGKTTEAEQILNALVTGDEVPAQRRLLLPKLLAVLRGDHAPALSQDAGLYYQDAVELQLLLESLGTK